MKSLSIVKYLILSVIISNCSIVCMAQTKDSVIFQDDISLLNVSSMLKELSSSYIKEFVKELPDKNTVNSILNRHCTKKFVEQYKNPELGIESFIQKDLLNDDLIKSIVVKKSKSEENNYFITILYNNNSVTLKIRVINNNELYKLDYIFINEPYEVTD